MTALRLLKRFDDKVKGHSDMVTLLHWDRKGLLSGGKDATIRYFTPHLEQKTILGIPRGMTASFIAFASPDEIVANTQDEKELLIYDIISGNEKKRVSFEFPLKIRRLSWKNEDLSFAGFGNNEIHLFNPLRISSTTKTIPAKDVKSLDVSPNYSYLFWADENRLHIYDIQDEKEIQRKVVSGSLSDISIHPSSPIVAIGHQDDSSVDLWDFSQIQALKKIRTIELIAEEGVGVVPREGVQGLQWSAKGALAIFPWYPWFYIYQNEQLKQFKFDQPLQAFAWKPDGSQFVVGSNRDILQGKPITNTPLDLVIHGNQQLNFGLQWEPIKNRLAYIKSGTTIAILEINELKHKHLLNVEKLFKKTDRIYALTWKDPLLAFAAEDSIFFIRTDSWKAESKLNNLSRLLAFSPVSSKLAAMILEDENYYLKIFDLKKKKIIFSILIEQDFTSYLTWSPNEQFLALGSGQSEILIVNLVNQKFQKLEGHKRTVFSVAWNDQSLLASASGDGTIKIWELNKKKPKIVLNSPST
ncbi:MAG: hypothetical protein ACFFBD_25550, partial [Candidatus Hodarchaeota archaeon]